MCVIREPLYICVLLPSFGMHMFIRVCLCVIIHAPHACVCMYVCVCMDMVCMCVWRQFVCVHVYGSVYRGDDYVIS